MIGHSAEQFEFESLRFNTMGDAIRHILDPRMCDPVRGGRSGVGNDREGSLQDRWCMHG